MHVPVLHQEVVDYLEPRSGGFYIDATVGAGGHSLRLLQASSPAGTIIALDRDPEALLIAEKNLSDYKKRVILVNTSYENMAAVINTRGIPAVDGILMDLGLSSIQLAESDRGFSFQSEGPLDMRFDRSSGRKAADIINTASEAELEKILREFGEVSQSRKISRLLIESRPVESTRQLAELVKKAAPHKGKIHPATQVFQAFRIAVNEELAILSKGLRVAVDILKIGGRLAVISFHSLEDRIVKRFFHELSQECTCPPEFPICVCDTSAVLELKHKKVIRPAAEEVAINPRSRSARMRVVEKIAEAEK